MANHFNIALRRTSSIGGGIVFLLLLYVSLAGAQPQPAWVDHLPVHSAPAGEPLLITADLKGDVYIDQVAEARVWYTEHGYEYYDFVSMYPVSREYSAHIPLDRLAADRIDYFIEFVMVDGATITYPRENPDIHPIEVVVEGATGAGQAARPIVILSPEPGSIWRSGEVQVVISINQDVRQMHPDALVVRVDGKNRTGALTVSRDMIIGTLTGLKGGEHRIDLMLANSDGFERVESWTFKIILPKIIKGRQQEFIHGDLRFSGIRQNVNDQDLGVAQEMVRLRGAYKSWTYEAKGRFSSQENRRLQPQNNYLATIANPWMRLNVGDVNPRYNRLVLNGRRVRGVELQLDLKYFKFQAIHGDMRRAIDSKVLSIDSTQIDNDPLNPLYQVDSTFQRGSYRRWINAFHYSLGNPDFLMMGFTLMKAKDDLHSINNGPASKDNLASGYDLQLYLDKKRISLYAESGLSLYNADTRPGAMNQYDQYAGYIVINQYFSPLPTDTSGNLEDVVASMVEQSLSYRTELRLQYFNNDLRFGLTKVNRAYRSLGVSGLRYDTRGWSVRDRIRLFRGFLSLNLGYEASHDNLLGKSDVTTQNRRTEVGFSLRRFWYAPNTSFTWRRILNENDGKQKTLVSGDLLENPIYTVIDQRILNTTNTFTLLLHRRVSLLGHEHDVSYNLTLSGRDDEYNSFGEAGQRLHTLSLNTYFPGGITSNLYFATADQTIGEGLTDFSSKTVSARVEYSMLNGNLMPFVNGSLNFGKGDIMYSPLSPEEQYRLSGADLTDPEVIAAIDTLTLTTARKAITDVVMIDYTLGVSWEFLRNHRLSGSLGFTHYLDNSKLQYWNGAEFPNDQVWITNSSDTVRITFQQPNAVRKQRNDFSFRINYAFRF